MKKLFVLLVTAFTLSCCYNDDSPKAATELDKLPPATQIGANTFGCLLDGKVFKPDGGNNSLQCYYQVVNYDYYFYIRGTKHIKPNTVVSIYEYPKRSKFFKEKPMIYLKKLTGIFLVLMPLG